MAVSKDAFTPNRGMLSQIYAAEIDDGNLYFSKDTNQIFCDIEGERHVMSHDGIRFVYGEAQPEEIKVDSINNEYTIPKSKIKNQPYPYYQEGMIIVNSPDNTFYRIEVIQESDVVCTKILVSGSGGSDDKIRLMAIPDPKTNEAGFNGSYRKGADVSAGFKIRDPLSTLPTVVCEVIYKETKESSVELKHERMQVPVGSTFYITLDGSVLKTGAGTNYIKILVTPSDGREPAFLEYNNFTVFDVTFAPTKDWERSLSQVIVQDAPRFVFPYSITANMAPENMEIYRMYIFDEEAGGWTMKGDRPDTTTGTGSDNLLDFILGNAQLGQGGHTVRVIAYMKYKGMLPGSEGIYLFDEQYSFGLYKNADTPVIWINNPHGNEVLNYTIIKLKYMVYDPLHQTDATVELYSNSKLVRTDTFDSTKRQWAEWQIVEYDVDSINTFTITCRGTSEKVNITVLNNTSMDLDSEKNGCALYLSAAGRSNNESAINRAKWPNKITNAVQGVTVGEVQLNNFNWATNGWIYNDKEDTQVLRVNNGAEVRIPLEAMGSASAQPRTYEFDFKVRNAIDYSRLVTYTEKPAGTPDEPDKTTIEKEIVTDGTGTFLTYYGNNKGIMLGTQEAFFAIGKTSVLNVRYTDNERVKISFAVDPNGTDIGGKSGLIYVYINGVLTGLYNFDKTANFENPANEIVINSNYCDVDLYNIRVYNTFLNYDRITQNWVGDATGLVEKMARYERNQKILDKDGNIDFVATMKSKLIPVMVIKTYDMRNGTPQIDKLDDKLPYSKIEKRAVDVRFYNPNDETMNFHAQNILCQVQGTSSETYPRRNFKIKLKEGDSTLATVRPFKFESWDGLDSSKDYYYDDTAHQETDRISGSGSKGLFNLSPDINAGHKESTFCLKADFMDSSSAHNTSLANLVQSLSVKYSDAYDVTHPLIRDFGINKTDYPFLRTTVFGFPMVIFHEDSKGNYTYVGKYNFNIDKSDTDTFGFTNKVQNPHTKHVEGVQREIPYTAKMCIRLDEATAATITADGAGNCVQYWTGGVSDQIKALAEYQATVGSKGYVNNLPAGAAHKAVKPLKWKNSTIMNPTESGARQMDSFAATFEPGLYAWKYDANAVSWSIYKASMTVPTSGSIPVEGAPLETGITVSQLTNATPGYEDYTFGPDSANFITSKYNIEFESYNTKAQLVDGTTFYLAVTDEITYPYKFVEQGIYEEAKAFADVAECWEFTDNQPGLGKFQMPDGADSSEPFYTVVTAADGLNRFLASKAFEMRYLPNDRNILDEYKNNPNDILGVNERCKSDYKNLEKVWSWTASTDTRAATNAPLGKTVYSLSLAPSTRDKSYYVEHKDTTYYVKDASAPDGYKVREITRVLTVAYTGSSTPTPTFTDSGTKFINLMRNLRAQAEGGDVSQVEDDELIATYTLTKHEDGFWYYGDTKVDLAEIALTVSDSYSDSSITFSIDDYYKGFQETNVILYEKFDTDSANYRLSKFKDEFDQHWDKAYCLFYFVLTEFLLLYDSRQKNMMIASWGPRSHTENGTDIVPDNYIWYPIFYDMDTQLGINNSGQVYWDYDVDATPLTGTNSIFSGNGSTLWDNFFKCFYPEIQQMYREMRKGNFQYDTLLRYYDQNGSDKWSEIMKNIDADYKYIAPASLERGYINGNGDLAEAGDKYFYCLQGDRKLNRDAFLRNRFNYIDSQWLAYAYNPDTIGGTQIKMRYNLNDSSQTSGMEATVRSNATFEILPYLSQYVSVVYDKNATSPTPFKLGKSEAVKVIPPTNIKNQENGTVALSQQLAYIRGPEYLSSIGDLSLKYLNEFDCGPAYRLRDLRLGNETEGYFNKGMSSNDLTIGGSLTDTNEGKGLLSFIDLSNLNEISEPINLDGCLKLEVFKALGTKLDGVNFANGNILKRVYLPNTLSSFVLLQPLVLDKLITDKADAREAKAEGETRPAGFNEGLYIQDLTDKLDNPNDTSIICRINKLHLSNDKMAFESYKIFDFLYKVKKNIIANSDVIYSDAGTMENKLLTIRLENVSWSEYEAVDPSTAYDGATITQYYKKLDNNTYMQLPASYTAAQWNSEKYDNVLYYKNTELTNPITNLDFFDQVCEEYDDDIAYPDKTNFYFRDIVDDVANPRKKVAPKISGRIHVANDAAHPIEESRITNYYNDKNHFPNLEITANYIAESYRATFIEYLEEDDNFARKVLYTHKIAKGTSGKTTVAYGGEKPSRNHRDFQGWMIVIPDNQEEQDYQIHESDIRKVGSVLSIEEADRRKKYTTDNLAVMLDMKNYPDGITLVAIYTVHKYPVYFYEYDNQTIFKGKPVQIDSGEYMHGPVGRPYKPITGEETLYRCYRFIGWTNSTTGTTPIDITKIRVQSEMHMYPLFVEDSVYNNPLQLDEMIYSWNTGGDGWFVGVKADVLGNTQKICFPNTITAQGHTNGRVIGIMGKTPQDNPELTNGLNGNPYITHVFFQGMPGRDDTDRTCYLINISEEAFAGSFSEPNPLVYVDLPPTLQTIGTAAFAFCNLSLISELPAFAGQGNHQIAMQRAFINAAHTGAVEEWPHTLVLPGTIALIGSDAFAQAGWREYIIGSKSSPLTQDAYQAYRSFGGFYLWGDRPAGFTDCYLPTKITVYASKSLDAATVKSLFESLVSNFAENYPAGNLVEVVQ